MRRSRAWRGLSVEIMPAKYSTISCGQVDDAHRALARAVDLRVAADLDDVGVPGDGPVAGAPAAGRGPRIRPYRAPRRRRGGARPAGGRRPPPARAGGRPQNAMSDRSMSSTASVGRWVTARPYRHGGRGSAGDRAGATGWSGAGPSGRASDGPRRPAPAATRGATSSRSESQSIEPVGPAGGLQGRACLVERALPARRHPARGRGHGGSGATGPVPGWPRPVDTVSVTGPSRWTAGRRTVPGAGPVPSPGESGR